MNQQENKTQLIKRALLVEDDNIAQRVVSIRLEDLGYEVELAQNATQAIELLEKNHYSLIVTDIGLPDKSGTVVIQTARQNELNQGTPILVTTAHSAKSDIKDYHELGANDVLVKPYKPEDFKKVIQKYWQWSELSKLRVIDLLLNG